MNRRKAIAAGLSASVLLGTGARVARAEPLIIRASWYKDCLDPHAMAYATVVYKSGTRLRLTTPVCLSVEVIVDSRGPHARHRSKGILFDLTPVAFSRLAGLELGLVPISKVEVLG